MEQHFIGRSCASIVYRCPLYPVLRCTLVLSVTMNASWSAYCVRGEVEKVQSVLEAVKSHLHVAERLCSVWNHSEEIVFSTVQQVLNTPRTYRRYALALL